MNNMKKAETIMHAFMDKLKNDEFDYDKLSAEEKQYIKDIIFTHSKNENEKDFMHGLDTGRKQGINLMSNKGRLLGYNQAVAAHNKSIHKMYENIKEQCPNVSSDDIEKIKTILFSEIQEIDSPCM